MRKTIKEYIELSNQEKSDLWNTATFVFDTNVFLNLYRYSNKTRNQLIESFKWLNSRIWMPYQVALEFCKDRYSVIDEANRRFDDLWATAGKLIDNWKEKLRLDSSDADIEALGKYLREWIEKKRDSNYPTVSATDDEVFSKLLDLFDGKVGKPFSEEERLSIEQEGEKRYAHRIPPGYGDSKKANNKFGDLLIWKEIIAYAKSKKLDIIFVTHDQKDDWWNDISGKTIGPRVELRKEFYEETGKMFHMYTMSSFLSFFTESNGKSIDKTTMDEVELFASVVRKKVSRAELNEYYASLEDNKEKAAAKLRFRITSLEHKNKKRRSNIHCLHQKAAKGSLSVDEEIALARNQENLIKDSIEINLLNERLEYLMSLEQSETLSQDT